MDDRLKTLFEEQRKLNDYIKESKKQQGLEFDYNEQEWIDKLTTAIIEEAMEIKAHANWKWWKRPKERSREELKEEIVDLLHFWISLCLKLGIPPEEIFEAYIKKNRENAARQDNGY